MQLTCLVALTACALSAEGYTSARHYVLRAPYEQVVARLTPEENQRKVYLACDAHLHELLHESFAYFPLRIGRRTRYCLRLPLVQANLESVEKVEVTADRMTIHSHLARGHWKVRCLNMKIVLTRDGDDRTRVSTSGTLQVNGMGRRLGWLLSDVMLQRLECGLRDATGKPVGE